MPRQTLQELHSQLRQSNFSFVPVGIVSLENIYVLVQQEFPNLCDDDYFCFENCRGGADQPEWKHRVRSALSHLKSVDGPVRKPANMKGYWEFHDL